MEGGGSESSCECATHFFLYSVFPRRCEPTSWLTRTGNQIAQMAHKKSAQFLEYEFIVSTESVICSILALFPHRPLVQASIYHLSRGGGGRVNYTDLTAANDIRKETVGGDRPILELQTPTCSYRCSDVPIQIQNAVDDAF